MGGKSRRERRQTQPAGVHGGVFIKNNEPVVSDPMPGTCGHGGWGVWS